MKSYFFFFFINQSLFEAMINFSGGDTAMRSSLEVKGKSLVWGLKNLHRVLLQHSEQSGEKTVPIAFLWEGGGGRLKRALNLKSE